ncbi:MAG: tetratricopeptide repeat protein [Parvibaculales bacterium]
MIAEIFFWGAISIMAGAVSVALCHSCKAVHFYALLLAALTPFFALVLYLMLGSPTMSALPLAERISGKMESLPIGAAIIRLEQRLAEKPEEINGWQILAQAQAALGRHEEAGDALRQVLARKGKGADILIAIAEQDALARDGDFSERESALLQQALDINPEHMGARYFYGVALLQQGFREDAASWWRLALEREGESEQSLYWGDIIRRQLLQLEGGE